MINKAEYGKLVKDRTKKSPLIKDILFAFLFGGTLCLLGEVLSELYKKQIKFPDNGAMAVSVTLIFLSALLTGLGVYDKLAKYGGAGTLVPITGFANAVVAPALEYKSEGFITGTGVKTFTIAGPVLMYGISASVVYGIILWVIGLFR